MYIFLYPNGEMEVRDSWDIEYKPPIGTYVYEPNTVFFAWTIQEQNGPRAIGMSHEIPAKCRAIELIYPRGG